MKIRAWISWLGCWIFILSASHPERSFAQGPARPVPPPSLRPAQAPVPTGKLTDALQIARSFTNGMVHVIVNLAPGQALRNANFSSKTSLATLRAENRKAQQDVLDNLPVNEVKVGFRFDNIAGFSAEVSANALQMLRADPRVVSIEPVFTLQAHLAQGIPLIHGMTYRSSYNGSGIAIAICDTGVDYNHARLGGGGFPNSKVLGGYDFGDSDANPIPNSQAHGTCCAGIAAGDLGTVGDYIGGVAYNAKIYALKISSGTSGSATTAAMVAAWDWCVTHQNDNPAYPIMVISTSFGGGQYFSTCDSATPSMTTAANNAVAAAITVLASSGNDGFCDSLAWPACISSVISVGAVYDAAFGHYYPCVSAASCAPKISTTGCTTGWYADDLTAADKVTSYANVASFLTLLAPGNQCYTLDITGASGYSTGDYYDSFGGTSAACPYAAGAVACLQSAAKALTGNYLSPQLIRTRLLAYGDNVSDTKAAVTKPRVNLEKAIQSLAQPALSLVSATLSGGNGNQSVDPNECSDLTVIVRNDGASTATNVSAVLSTSTPGLSVIQSTSTYPNVAAAATATNTSAFRISTSPSFVCGSPVNLTLTVSYVGGTNTNSFSLVSGGTNYVVVPTAGAAIIPGTTDIGNHGDDVATTISLPFSYTFYGQAFSSATLSANGNLQFSSSDIAYGNVCLPYNGFSYAIIPFWDDLRTDCTNGGIFTSVSGVAPNRIFNIEWRARYYNSVCNNGASVSFELRLYEGQPRFDIICGPLNGTGSGVTVGVQKDTGSAFTQFECNSGGLSNSLQLAFQPGCTDGGGQCLGTPVANFTGNPTSGSAPLSVSFINLSTSATNYSWNFGDGKTSTATNAANTYSNAGSYTVRLTAIGPGGTNSLTNVNYIVVTNAAPVANFVGGPTNGMSPLTVNFTNLSTGATNYSWTFGEGHSSTATNTANTYSNAGSYTITLQAVGLGGMNTLVRNNYVILSNAPPVLAPITNRIVLEETLLTFTASARDPDVNQTLAFSLDLPVPEGASINAGSGVFTWTPSLAFASTTNSMTVRVTDDGSPAASAARAFNVTVVARPRLLSVAEEPDGFFTLVWQVYPGRTYRSEFKTNLTDAVWTTLGADFIAATASATVTNNAGTNLHAFYRVRDVTGP